MFEIDLKNLDHIEKFQNIKNKRLILITHDLSLTYFVFDFIM